MDVKQYLKYKIDESRKISFKDPSQAFDMASEARLMARTNGLIQEEAQALFAMALACRSMTRLTDCYDYAFDSYKLFESCNNSFGMATSLNLIGVVYFYNAIYERALESFLKASRMLDEERDSLTLTRVFNNMGEVYREVGNLDAALAAYEKAMLFCQKTDSEDTFAVILENIGEVYFKKCEYEKSHEFFNKGYEILVRSNDVTTAIAEVENKLGRIHYIWNQQNTARELYNSALKKLDDIGNHFFVIDVLINLAELEMHENEKLSIEYLSTAIKYGEELNARKKLSVIYKMLTDFYEIKKDFELALNFYKRYHKMEQEIETAIISNKLEIYKLELEKLFKGEELDKIKKLNTQLEKDINKQNSILESMERTNRNLSMEIMLDELTHIPNRRGVKNYLREVWNSSVHKPFDATLFMMDIDYFKRFNDCHGHPEGDKCLKIISDCFKKSFDCIGGMVGRFGGEEFVGFVMDVDYQKSLEFAEHIRISVEKLGLTYFWEGMEYPVTVSIGGVFGNCLCFSDYPDMVTIADKKLFDAKNAGRNNVSIEHFGN